jgi:PAS domain S-box-containing protein
VTEQRERCVDHLTAAVAATDPDEKDRHLERALGALDADSDDEAPERDDDADDGAPDFGFSSAQHQTYLEHATDLITVLDLDGTIRYENEAVEDVLGFDRAERIGENGFSYIHPEDREGAEASFREAIERPTTEPTTVVLRSRAADGSWRWLESRANYNLTGETGEIVAASRDITERKRREAELKRVKDQTEFVLTEVDTTVWVGDPVSGDLTTLYNPIEAVTGQSCGGTMDDFVTDIVHPEDRERIADAYDRLVDGDADRLAAEFRTQHGIEDTQWLRAVGYWREDDSKIVGILSDISDRKRRERQLEEFAGLVSHDLRNPLNVAQGRLELAREEDDSEPLAAVADSLDRMREIIDDTLLFAKQGQTIEDPDAVALDAVAADCWRNVDTADADLRVECEFTVSGDPDRLRSLFENLFRNAVEHGGEDVTVRVAPTDAGFYVADDGPGIRPEQRDRVFDPGHSTAERGTGFGLAIVEEVAAAHDWRVGVEESEPGGTRITFTGVDRVDK